MINPRMIRNNSISNAVINNNTVISSNREQQQAANRDDETPANLQQPPPLASWTIQQQQQQSSPRSNDYNNNNNKILTTNLDNTSSAPTQNNINLNTVGVGIGSYRHQYQKSSNALNNNTDECLQDDFHDGVDHTNNNNKLQSQLQSASLNTPSTVIPDNASFRTAAAASNNSSSNNNNNSSNRQTSVPGIVGNETALHNFVGSFVATAAASNNNNNNNSNNNNNNNNNSNNCFVVSKSEVMKIPGKESSFFFVNSTDNINKNSSLVVGNQPQLQQQRNPSIHDFGYYQNQQQQQQYVQQDTTSKLLPSAKLEGSNNNNNDHSNRGNTKTTQSQQVVSTGGISSFFVRRPLLPQHLQNARPPSLMHFAADSTNTNQHDLLFGTSGKDSQNHHHNSQNQKQPMTTTTFKKSAEATGDDGSMFHNVANTPFVKRRNRADFAASSNNRDEQVASPLLPRGASGQQQDERDKRKESRVLTPRTALLPQHDQKNAQGHNSNQQDALPHCVDDEHHDDEHKKTQRINFIADDDDDDVDDEAARKQQQQQRLLNSNDATQYYYVAAGPDHVFSLSEDEFVYCETDHSDDKIMNNNPTIEGMDVNTVHNDNNNVCGETTPDREGKGADQNHVGPTSVLQQKEKAKAKIDTSDPIVNNVNKDFFSSSVTSRHAQNSESSHSSDDYEEAEKLLRHRRPHQAKSKKSKILIDETKNNNKMIHHRANNNQHTFSSLRPEVLLENSYWSNQNHNLVEGNVCVRSLKRRQLLENNRKGETAHGTGDEVLMNYFSLLATANSQDKEIILSTKNNKNDSQNNKNNSTATKNANSDGIDNTPKDDDDDEGDQLVGIGVDGGSGVKADHELTVPAARDDDFMPWYIAWLHSFLYYPCDPSDPNAMKYAVRALYVVATFIAVVSIYFPLGVYFLVCGGESIYIKSQMANYGMLFSNFSHLLAGDTENGCSTMINDSTALDLVAGITTLLFTFGVALPNLLVLKCGAGRVGDMHIQASFFGFSIMMFIYMLCIPRFQHHAAVGVVIHSAVTVQLLPLSRFKFLVAVTGFMYPIALYNLNVGTSVHDKNGNDGSWGFASFYPGHEHLGTAWLLAVQIICAGFAILLTPLAVFVVYYDSSIWRKAAVSDSAMMISITKRIKFLEFGKALRRFKLHEKKLDAELDKLMMFNEDENNNNNNNKDAVNKEEQRNEASHNDVEEKSNAGVPFYQLSKKKVEQTHKKLVASKNFFASVESIINNVSQAARFSDFDLVSSVAPITRKLLRQFLQMEEAQREQTRTTGLEKGTLNDNVYNNNTSRPSSPMSLQSPHSTLGNNNNNGDNGDERRGFWGSQHQQQHQAMAVATPVDGNGNNSNNIAIDDANNNTSVVNVVQVSAAGGVPLQPSTSLTTVGSLDTTASSTNASSTASNATKMQQLQNRNMLHLLDKRMITVLHLEISRFVEFTEAMMTLDDDLFLQHQQQNAENNNNNNNPKLGAENTKQFSSTAFRESNTNGNWSKGSFGTASSLRLSSQEKILGVLFELLRRTVLRHHGLLIESFGNTVIAAWGVSQLSQHPKLQSYASSLACACGMKILSDVKNLFAPFVKNETGFENFSVRIGIHRGVDCSCGLIGTTTDSCSLSEKDNIDVNEKGRHKNNNNNNNNNALSSCSSASGTLNKSNGKSNAKEFRTSVGRAYAMTGYMDIRKNIFGEEQQSPSFHDDDDDDVVTRRNRCDSNDDLQNSDSDRKTKSAASSRRKTIRLENNIDNYQQFVSQNQEQNYHVVDLLTMNGEGNHGQNQQQQPQQKNQSHHHNKKPRVKNPFMVPSIFTMDAIKQHHFHSPVVSCKYAVVGPVADIAASLCKLNTETNDGQSAIIISHDMFFDLDPSTDFFFRDDNDANADDDNEELQRREAVKNRNDNNNNNNNNNNYRYNADENESSSSPSNSAEDFGSMKDKRKPNGTRNDHDECEMNIVELMNHKKQNFLLLGDGRGAATHMQQKQQRANAGKNNDDDDDEDETPSIHKHNNNSKNKYLDTQDTKDEILVPGAVKNVDQNGVNKAPTRGNADHDSNRRKKSNLLQSILSNYTFALHDLGTKKLVAALQETKTHSVKCHQLIGITESEKSLTRKREAETNKILALEQKQEEEANRENQQRQQQNLRSRKVDNAQFFRPPSDERDKNDNKNGTSVDSAKRDASKRMKMDQPDGIQAIVPSKVTVNDNEDSSGNTDKPQSSITSQFGFSPARQAVNHNNNNVNRKDANEKILVKKLPQQQQQQIRQVPRSDGNVPVRDSLLTIQNQSLQTQNTETSPNNNNSSTVGEDSSANLGNKNNNKNNSQQRNNNNDSRPIHHILLDRSSATVDQQDIHQQKKQQQQHQQQKRAPAVTNSLDDSSRRQQNQQSDARAADVVNLFTGTRTSLEENLMIVKRNNNNNNNNQNQINDNVSKSMETSSDRVSRKQQDEIVSTNDLGIFPCETGTNNSQHQQQQNLTSTNDAKQGVSAPSAGLFTIAEKRQLAKKLASKNDDKNKNGLQLASNDWSSGDAEDDDDDDDENETRRRRQGENNSNGDEQQQQRHGAANSNSNDDDEDDDGDNNDHNNFAENYDFDDDYNDNVNDASEDERMESGRNLQRREDRIVSSCILSIQSTLVSTFRDLERFLFVDQESFNALKLFNNATSLVATGTTTPGSTLGGATGVGVGVGGTAGCYNALQVYRELADIRRNSFTLDDPTGGRWVCVALFDQGVNGQLLEKKLEEFQKKVDKQQRKKN